MQLLLDQEIYKGILRITATILQNHFYYSLESLERFFDCFAEAVEDAYILFQETASEGFLDQIKEDTTARREFTSTFISTQMHEVLVYDLHFTELELDCFELFLPHCTGANDDTKQSHKRTHY
jgi:hypothetical protein